MAAPSGDIHFGNGGTGYDTVNVNEQITISNPVKGMWKVNPYTAMSIFPVWAI